MDTSIVTKMSVIGTECTSVDSPFSISHHHQDRVAVRWLEIESQPFHLYPVRTAHYPSASCISKHAPARHRMFPWYSVVSTGDFIAAHRTTKRMHKLWTPAQVVPWEIVSPNTLIDLSRAVHLEG